MGLECVILCRNPGSGRVIYIGEDGDNDDIAVFTDRDDAIKAAGNIPIIQAGWPYQIVELDEL